MPRQPDLIIEKHKGLMYGSLSYTTIDTERKILNPKNEAKNNAIDNSIIKIDTSGKVFKLSINDEELINFLELNKPHKDINIKKKNFRILLDIFVDEKSVKKNRLKISQLELDISKFLLIKKLTTPNIPTLSAADVRLLFDNIKNNHIKDLKKKVNISIKIEYENILYELLSKKCKVMHETRILSYKNFEINI